MNVFKFNLIKESKKPIYIQLYSFIKKEIELGELKANDKLPSKRKLAASLEISQNTVESAYSQLIVEGYVKSVEKKGYYVLEIASLLNSNKENLINYENKKEKNNYKYEFLSSRVDLNSFPYSLWKKINKDIINEDNKDILQLGHSQGDYNLRHEIASYLKASRGVNTSPYNIVIGAGSEYLIQLLIGLIGIDKSYGMEEPGYYKIRNILKNFNIDIEGIEIDENGIKVDDLKESKINVAYITPSHQFPTGVIMPIKRRLELLKWANEDLNRYIIEDDYDSEFRFEGKPIPSLQSLDSKNKVIYIGTLSKAFAPSIRLAYMVLPKELIDLYRERYSFYACTVSRLTQQVIYKFIKDGHFERHLNKMRNIYKRKREFLVNEIKNNFNNVEIIGTNSGLHLLIKISNNMSEEELIERAKKEKVRVLGISTSYKNKKSNESIISLGYGGLTLEEIREGILLLKKAWNM